MGIEKIMTETNGLYYEQHGQPDKPAILLLHGFMGSGREWEPVINKLKQDFTALTIDLPGHGRSRLNAEENSYTMPETTKQIIFVLDQLEVQKCPVIGYSMGGRLALNLVLKYPGRFTHLILESASPGIIDMFDRENRQRHDEFLAEKLVSDDFETFVLKWYYQPVFRSLTSHPDFQKLLYLRLGNDPAELAKSLRSMGQGNQEPLWDKLEGINIPVLLIAGENDAKYTGIIQDMKRFNPGFETEVFKNCGHNIHFENPDKFSGRILEFLNNRSSS